MKSNFKNVPWLSIFLSLLKMNKYWNLNMLKHSNMFYCLSTETEIRSPFWDFKFLCSFDSMFMVCSNQQIHSWSDTYKWFTRVCCIRLISCIKGHSSLKLSCAKYFFSVFGDILVNETQWNPQTERKRSTYMATWTSVWWTCTPHSKSEYKFGIGICHEAHVLPNVSFRLHQISPGFLCISLHSLLPSTLTSLLQRGTIMPLGMFMTTCSATWCLVWWPESSISVSVTLDSPSSWLQSPPHAFWKIIVEISRVSCCPLLSRLLFALFKDWRALGPFTAVSYSFHFNTAPVCWLWLINAKQELLFAGTEHNMYILRKQNCVF